MGEFVYVDIPLRKKRGGLRSSTSMAQSRRALKHHWKSNEIKNIFNKSPLRESSKYAKEEYFAQSLGWQYRQAPHKNFIQKIALQRE